MRNSLPGRRTRILVVLTALLVVLGSLMATPASAALTSREKKLAALVNKARVNHKRGKLQVSAKLSMLAHKHSSAMAAKDEPLLHSTSNQLLSYMGTVNCVARIGENVGTNYTVPAMHKAFMDSPGHRENILETYWTKVGVGVKKVDGMLWVTELFCV